MLGTGDEPVPRLNSVADYVRIGERGAIVLGTLCVDGHENSCLFRVVTHMHSDHIIDLRKSIAACLGIIATPETHALLEELGYKIPRSKRFELKYRSKSVLDNLELVLEKSKHIVGSCQVLVRNRDMGVEIGYTGDFKDPGVGTPVLKPDVLVIDATYGHPSYVRVSSSVAVNAFVDLVKVGLREGPVYVYAYHGKLQEAMSILRDHGVDAPFLTSYRIWKMTWRLRDFGLEINDLFYRGSPEGAEVEKSGWYVYFDHFSQFWKREGLGSLDGGSTHILLTGWLFRKAVRRLSHGSWMVALSDHADFVELVRYVEESRPQLLIVDGFRGGAAAKAFAEYVEKNLGIKAVVLP